jgi:hypothetical protein
VLEDGKEEVVVLGGGDPIVEGGAFISGFGCAFEGSGGSTEPIKSSALAMTSRIVDGPVFGGGGDKEVVNLVSLVDPVR